MKRLKEWALLALVVAYGFVVAALWDRKSEPEWSRD